MSKSKELLEKLNNNSIYLNEDYLEFYKVWQNPKDNLYYVLRKIRGNHYKKVSKGFKNKAHANFHKTALRKEDVRGEDVVA